MKLAFMLKRSHGDKRFTFLFCKSKNKKSQASILELVKATGNVAVGWCVVGCEYLLVFMRKQENMHTAAEHKLQLIASNLSSHNTFFYIPLLGIGKVSLITRKEICYHRSLVNVVDLISEGMTCYNKQSDKWSKVIRNCNFKEDF